ncbi:MAG: tetratricopeptide repeat protein, partial [Anaerolineaceae bacterium]|nr:tetratricopeptide repeat protein [Anaerolineaceae bacterium]
MNSASSSDSKSQQNAVPAASNQTAGQTPPILETSDTQRAWEWLSFFGLLAIIFLLLSLWYRWLKPDPEFLGFTTSIVELLAIASLLGLQTEVGQNLVLRLDDTLGVGRFIKSKRRLCGMVWLLAGLLAGLLYLGSPQAARLYRQWGVSALEDGNYSRAIRQFQQALSLDPG